MMVKWGNDGILQANDGKMLVDDGEMLFNDVEMSVWSYNQFTIIDGYSVSDIICKNMLCIYREIFHTFIAFMYLPSLEKRSHNWLYWDREIDIVYTVSQSSVRTLFEERPVVEGAEGVSNVCYIKV